MGTGLLVVLLSTDRVILLITTLQLTTDTRQLCIHKERITLTIEDIINVGEVQLSMVTT